MNTITKSPFPFSSHRDNHDLLISLFRILHVSDHAMDPLSVTASIVAVVQITATVIDYLRSIKDAPKDRARLAIEASSVYNRLVNLQYRLEEGERGERWFTGIRALAVQNGPLDQYRNTLEQLQEKITGGGRLRKLGDALLWKFTK